MYHNLENISMAFTSILCTIEELDDELSEKEDEIETLKKELEEARKGVK
jgi:predicted RNase H-like nuclease (RuvC/YqgF family)